MSLRVSTVLILTVFTVALAFQVINRLSTDAMNLGVGVLCGMVASLPVSLGLLVALTRERAELSEAEDEEAEPEPSYSEPVMPRAMPQPHVIVVAPPQNPYGQGYPPYPQYGYGPATYPAEDAEDVIEGRDWRIIGDEE